jgi:hypothetical protein
MRCRRCNKKGVFIKKKESDLLLLIDHIDNDNDNNDLDNLQLLCRSCNGLKNPRGKYASPAKQPRDKGEISFMMRKSLTIGRIATEWMKKTIVDDTRLLKEEVVQRLAFVCDASVITTDRWIRKAVVNEEPECPYCTFMDDDENVWIERKKAL